jgi:DNA-binding LacI/PurR family transcriptional regulator
MKTYTIFDVAKLSRVSVSTVSRYFANSGKLRDENKDSIDAVISKTGYYPNLNARALGRLNGNKRR